MDLVCLRTILYCLTPHKQTHFTDSKIRNFKLFQLPIKSKRIIIDSSKSNFHRHRRLTVKKQSLKSYVSQLLPYQVLDRFQSHIITVIISQTQSSVKTQHIN